MILKRRYSLSFPFEEDIYWIEHISKHNFSLLLIATTKQIRRSDEIPVKPSKRFVPRNPFSKETEYSYFA